MQFFLNNLHLTNGGSTDSEDCDCVIHKTFYGKLQSNVTCQNCGGVTTAVEPFLDLSLGLESISKKNTTKSGQKRPSVLTLQRCLTEEYMRPERCEYTCHKCNGPQDARKQLSIKRLPNVLCIQFKVPKLSPPNKSMEG